MAAKGKYCDDIVKMICDSIAVYGQDAAACRAVKINPDTFYEWIKTKPDFSDAVTAARQEFRLSGMNSIKRLGNKALVDYLTGSMIKVSHCKKEVISPTGEIVEVEENRTVPVGVPRWAVERAIGSGLTEVDALMRLAELGLIPSWVVDCATRMLDQVRDEIRTLIQGQLPEPLLYQLSKERESTGGLSEDTYNRIRAEIMGIDAQSVSQLPAKVSSESVAG